MINSSDLALIGYFDLATNASTGQTNTSFRDVVLEDTTDYLGLSAVLTDIIGYFIIKDPTGIVIHEGSVSSPDIDADINLSVTFTELIPLDSLQAPLTGDYSVKYIVRHTPGSSTFDIETDWISVKVCGKKCDADANACVEISSDCYEATATGKDTSEYGSGATVVSRELILTPPTGALYSSGIVATPFTATGNEITTSSGILWSNNWQLLVRTVVEYAVGSGNYDFKVSDYFTAATNKDIVCDFDMCGLHKCLNQEILDIEEEACATGGMSGKKLGDRIHKLILYKTRLDIARYCGDRDAIQDYYNQLKDLLNCNCGCCSSDGPNLITPVISSNGSIDVIGGTGITVINNSGTYTVSLSSSIVTLINSIKQSEVISSDGTIGVDLNILLDGTYSYDLSALTGAPAALPDTIEILKNTIATIPVTENDFFSSNIVVSIVTPPNNGAAIILGDGKTLQYTPINNYVGLETIEYQITDQLGRTSNAVITITVVDQVASSCDTIVAGYVATLFEDSGQVKALIVNTTNYYNNDPGNITYQLFVRDNTNAILHSYSFAGSATSVATEFITPDTINSNWDNIRIVLTTDSSVDGATIQCGTFNYETSNAFNIPTSSTSLFNGVDISCFGLTNPTDEEILQWMVNQICGIGTDLPETNPDSISVMEGAIAIVNLVANDLIPGVLQSVELLDTSIYGVFTELTNNSGTFVFHALSDATGGETSVSETVRYQVTDTGGNTSISTIDINVYEGLEIIAGLCMSALVNFIQNEQDSVITIVAKAISNNVAYVLDVANSYVDITNNNIPTSPERILLAAFLPPLSTSAWGATFTFTDNNSPAASGNTTFDFHLEFLNGEIKDRSIIVPSAGHGETQQNRFCLRLGAPTTFLFGNNGVCISREFNGDKFVWELDIPANFTLISGSLNISYSEICGTTTGPINERDVTISQLGANTTTNFGSVTGDLSSGEVNLNYLPDGCAAPGPHYADDTSFVFNLNFENATGAPINYFNTFIIDTDNNPPEDFKQQCFLQATANEATIYLDTLVLTTAPNGNFTFDAALVATLTIPGVGGGLDLDLNATSFILIGVSVGSGLQLMDPNHYSIDIQRVSVNQDDYAITISLFDISTDLDQSPPKIVADFDFILTNGVRYVGGTVNLIGGDPALTIQPT